MAREVDIRGDSSKAFPVLIDPSSITHARVMASKYEEWTAIGELRNLESLEIVHFSGVDLECLRPLTNLVQLSITSLDKVGSLDPLSDLVSLRRLVLENDTSAFINGKTHKVASIAPLRGLPLEEVQPLGVCPVIKSVDDLLAIPSLKRARVARFGVKEQNRLRKVVPDDFVDWDMIDWGSAAEVAHKGPLPIGITFRDAPQDP